jgi:hypothetical protein
LNGGASFAVSGQGTAPQTIQNLAEPLPLIPIGGKLQVGKKNTLILNAGNASVRSSGGPEVGSFLIAAQMPSPLTWTDRDQILRIDRTKPLTLNWTGSSTGSTVAVLGMDADQSSNATAAFLCVAPDGATSFTVPDYVLAGMPASRQWPFKSLAALFVGALPMAAPTTFTANGLDLGAVLPAVISMKQVIFR